MLDEIAATGYTGMELGPYGFLATDPDAARAGLQKRNLTIIAAFVPVKLVDEAAGSACERGGYIRWFWGKGEIGPIMAGERV